MKFLILIIIIALIAAAFFLLPDLNSKNSDEFNTEKLINDIKNQRSDKCIDTCADQFCQEDQNGELDCADVNLLKNCTDLCERNQ
ncbi:MAG: hypothetical protein WC693_04195 [Patescibacteria group bacterium]|jgi:hypothetical protein